MTWQVLMMPTSRNKSDRCRIRRWCSYYYYYYCYYYRNSGLTVQALLILAGVDVVINWNRRLSDREVQVGGVGSSLLLNVALEPVSDSQHQNFVYFLKLELLKSHRVRLTTDGLANSHFQVILITSSLSLTFSAFSHDLRVLSHLESTLVLLESVRTEVKGQQSLLFSGSHEFR